MNLSNNFNIVVWNAQSINNKHDTISLFLDSHKPSILVITESHFMNSITHLSSLYVNNPHYTCINYNHSRAYSGGSVFFIHSSVQYTLRCDLHLNPRKLNSRKHPSSMHWLQLKVNSIPHSIFLGITYIHPKCTVHDINEINKNIINCQNVASGLLSSVLLTGDFNQHCSEWGQSSPPHTAHPILVNSFTSLNLSNLNLIYDPDQPTHTKSIIDLAFSDSPAIISHFEVAKHFPLLSDHKPILITLKSNHINVTPKQQPTFNFEKADWSAYNAHLKTHVASYNQLFDSIVRDPANNTLKNRMKSITTLWDKLSTMIHLSASMSIPLVKVSKNYNHWWKYEPDLPNMREKYRQAKYVYVNSRTPETKNALKVAYSSFRALCRSAKNQHHKKKVEKIVDNVTHEILWNHYTKLSPRTKQSLDNINNNQHMPPTSPTESLNNLAHNFAEISKPTLLRNLEDLKIHYEVENEYNKVSKEMLSSNYIDESIFSKERVERACRYMKMHTSAGPDSLASMLIICGHETLPLLFKSLFELSYSWGIQPQDWRDAIIAPLYKNSGDVNESANYRPISLTSIIIRMFERLLLCIFQQKLTHNNVYAIYQQQAGFRDRFACADQLYQLTHHIGQTYRNKSFLPVTFIDISKAYDTVWIAGLLWKCFKIGITGRLFVWLYNFLHHRRIRVRSCSTLSDFYDLFSGLPQGSVLAPLLFLIYINDLIPLVQVSHTEILLFADDISLFPSCYGDDKTHYDTLQNALHYCTQWAKKWHITFSESKTATVIFTKKYRMKFKAPVLLLQGKTVQYQSHYKYLGIILENNGSCNLHLKHVINKLHFHKYNIMKLCRNYVRLSPTIIRTLVKCIMGTRVTYGLPFYHPNFSQINKINSLIISTLTSSLHLRAHPHHHSVSFELNMPSFYTMRDVELIRFWSRIKCLPENHPSKILYEKEITLLNDEPSRYLVSDIYPLFSSKINQVCSIWNIHLPIDPEQLENEARIQIVNEWNSTPQGKLLKSLYHHQSTIPLDSPFYLKYDTPRIAQVRARLRFDRTILNNRISKYNPLHPNYCIYCYTNFQTKPLDTPEHLLLHCPQFHVDRLTVQSTLLTHHTFISLPLLLGCVDHLNDKLHKPLLKITSNFISNILSVRRI
jgi:hypothetical protein